MTSEKHEFYQALDISISRATKHHFKVGFLKIKLDNFSRVNSLYSPELSDAYLDFVEEGLKTLVNPVDYVSRIFEDQFAIVIDGIQDVSDIALLSHRIEKFFSEPHVINGTSMAFTVSMGVSIFPDLSKTAEGLIMAANCALAHASASGGNAIEFDSPVLNAKCNRDMGIIHALHTAIERNEFHLVYQPQIYSDSKKLAGYEALLRWTHPTLGVVSPAEFIPLAERSKLIADIDHWVFENVLQQYATWMDKYYRSMGNIKPSINLSATNLLDNKLMEWISGLLVKHALSPSQIIIELTETSIMNNLDQGLMVIEGLRNMGCGIALDDFGTGYSSLTLFYKLPITQLKIDRSFIESTSTNNKSAVIVKALILIADALNLEIVAEGVETEQEFKYLKDNNCHIIQGYLFSKPLSAVDMELYIKNHA